jgi:hypothetical protein
VAKIQIIFQIWREKPEYFTIDPVFQNETKQEWNKGSTHRGSGDQEEFPECRDFRISDFRFHIPDFTFKYLIKHILHFYAKTLI